MNKLKVVFYPNGLTGAFRNGEQVPELQESWFQLYLLELVRQGIDPEEVEFILPCGDGASVFETSEGGYNWKILIDLKLTAKGRSVIHGERHETKSN